MFDFAYKADLEELQKKFADDLSKLNSDIELKYQKLQSDINQNATVSDQIAKQAAASAKSYEDSAKSAYQKIAEGIGSIETIRSNAESIRQKLTEEQEFITEKNDNLQEKIDKTHEAYNTIINTQTTINSTLEKIQSDADKISQYLLESKELPSQVDNIKSLVAQSNQNITSINDLLNHAITKKSDIDEIYKEIFGSEILKSDGEIERTVGLKDQLENSYKKIAENIKKLDSNIASSIEEITKKHEATLETQNTEFHELTSSSSKTIESIKNQLKSLLPGAMAAGLSAAYEKKKNDETETLNRFEKNFKYAIFGLVGVSLIPFSVDIYLLGWKSHELINVIKDTPSLIISILPLYFPILWLAYSSNKKVNLSKRLIEEYTHKSVLGNTFSGLSNQIENLPHEGKVKEELRTKLLFSILQVSSENPGKLITDYQKSDHPLMEALEKSAKLSEAVESLSKIPGLGSLAKTLSEKGEKILNEQTRKIEDGLNINSAIEGKQDQENNDPAEKQ